MLYKFVNPLHTMERYTEYLSQLAANGGVNKNFSNSDEEHALEVLVKIFQISQHSIRIFAGSLCSAVPNNPQYIAALSDFIEKDGEVKILLNNLDRDRAKESNLFKRLAYYISLDKNIKLYTTEVKPFLAEDPQKKEVHFTVGDEKAYRVETDIEKRTANCNFNNPQDAANLITFFDEIVSERAQEINLNEYFAE